MRITVTNPNTKTIIDSDSVKVDIQELSGIENSSCVEVNLNDCMDYVPYNERLKLLEMAINKMRYGATIYISGTDLDSMSHSIKYNLAGIQQTNAALYNGRLSVDFMHHILEIIDQVGLEIEKVSLENLYYFIKAKRPNA